MQTDENPYVPGPRENPLYTAEPLTLDDLKLLSDLFYLPYEYGTTAKDMLEELNWLKTHRQAAAAQTHQVVGSPFFTSCFHVVLRKPSLQLCFSERRVAL